MSSLGLYKAGQGYWVRVLTATMAGIVILAGCAWLWQELQRASVYIPRPTWSLTLGAGAQGTAQPGQAITLLGEPVAGAPAPEIGKATVSQVDASQLVIRRPTMVAGHDPSQIRAVAPAPGGATLSGFVSGQPQGIPLFDQLYLQAGGVALLMLLGAGLTYWYTGVRPRTVEFLIATDGEMKKVNWSSRKDIVASTWVVILWSVLLAGGLFAVDSIFALVFRLIGVLQTK